MPLFLHINKYLSRLLPVAVLFLTARPARAQLKADFTADKTGGCSPLSVTFSNTTTGASVNATYSWDLGNGRTSVLPNPGSVYTTEQSYTITLTVRDGTAISTRSETITVYKKPTVDFSVSPVQGCVPLPVILNSQSQAGDGALSNYFWDFGDGATQQGSTLSQVSHTYLFAQTATVSLTVTNSNGCNNTLQKTAATIAPAIKAGFNVDKTVLCQTGDAARFTNTSIGTPLTYDWDFGDGNHSSDENPVHVYAQKGVYTVILTATSPGGCVDISTQTNLVHVADFVTDFSWTDPVCPGDITSFKDISTPSIHISHWFYEDLDVPGPHPVTLTNTYGTCPQTITKTVIVQGAPTLKDFAFNFEGSCGAPVTVDFTDTSTTTVRWQWNFGPAGATSGIQNPSYTYTTEGNFFPQLIITNSAGCSATFQKPLSTYKPQVFVNYKNSSSASGNVACSDLTMTFTASSGNDPIIRYNWDFGDGGHSTDAEPVHTFTIPGTYIIHLSYITAGGCQGVAEYSAVRRYQKPVAAFTASSTTICGNELVQLTDQSQGPIASWSWNLGSGIPVALIANPSFRYLTDGSYTITLIVSNDVCSDTLVKQDYIQVLPPFPQIGSVINTCDDTRGLVRFTQSTIKGNSWVWDFGDGATLPPGADQQTVEHTYTATGSYKVVLSATNGGCTVRDSTVIGVLLKQHPVLSADKETACTSDLLGVAVTNLDANPANYTYFEPYGYTFADWQYNDLSSFPGTYSPMGIPWGGNSYAGNLSGLTNGKSGLRAILKESVFGCSDTSNFIPLVIRGPSASYSILSNNVCFHSPIVLKDGSSGNNNVPIVSWQWNFEDGSSQLLGQGTDVSHLYSDPGYYRPQLTVTDEEGCSATMSSSSYVQVNGPKAAFDWSPTIVSPGTLLFFFNTTNTIGSSAPTYQWSFGDGSNTTDAYPSHTYSSVGTDTITLTAKDASTQCTDSSKQVVYVKTLHALFTYTTTYVSNNSCPPVIVHFTNTSINVNSVSWNFGDGSVASNQNYPSHTYYKPGFYRAVLYGVGNNGATDSVVNIITVKGPFATLKTDTTSGCTGQTVTLSALVQQSRSFTWDFGDGTLTKSSDTSAIHTYLTGGVYTPALIMEDENGCQATSSLDNPIIIDSLHIAFANMPPHVCDSTLLTLDPEVQSIAAAQLQRTLQYKWDFGTGVAGDTAIGVSASFTYHRAGEYPVSLQVRSPYGCQQNITHMLLVADPQPFTLSMTKDTFACPATSLQLEAAGAVSYHWMNAPGLDDQDIANPIARPPLAGAYSVIGYDRYACFADTATMTVDMKPSPTVDAGADLVIPTGSTLPLNVTGSSDVIQWNWTPPDYLSCTDCTSPICTPRSSLQYIVTGKSQYGCPASDTLNLKLICDQGRVYISNSFTPNGDGKNDIFYIKGRGIRVINYLRIFNRWGEIIFERGHFNIDDRSVGWDGTFKGRPVETGTYVYLTEMVCDNGEVFPLKGTFTVVR